MPASNPKVRVWPAVLPDETLFSVIAQYRFLLRGSARLNALLGEGNAFLGGGFPTHFGELAQHLAGTSSRWSADELIQQLSFVPYIQFFFDSIVVQRVKHLMLGKDGRGIKTLLGWVAGRIGAAEPLRACRACYLDDLRMYGRPYWHRSHLLPCVSCCHIHRLNLVPVTGPAEGVRRFMPFLPPLFIPREITDTAPILGVRFADWSSWYLNTPPDWVCAKALQELYLGRLQELGFMTTSGRVRQQEFQEWVRHTLQRSGKDCPRGLRKMVSNGYAPWMTKILRKPRNVLHPAKHILLQLLLFNDKQDFQKRLLAHGKPETGVGINKNSSSNFRLKLPQDIAGRSLREISACTHVSITTLSVELQRQGHTLKRRPKTLTDHRLTNIKKCLEEGNSLEVICQHEGVSVASLYRILRANPATRSKRLLVVQKTKLHQRKTAVLAWIKSNPGATRSKMEIACEKHIAWLRRHDRDWLRGILGSFTKSVIRKKTTVDWKARDTVLLPRLEAAYQRLMVWTGKPRRIYSASICRDANLQTLLPRCRKKLPLCNVFLLTHTDTNESFCAKRIRWAWNELSSQGNAVTVSALIRYASIRCPSDCDIFTDSLKPIRSG